MATISIFSIRLGRLLLSCERHLATGYVLISQTFRAPMSLDVAAALGEAAWRIQRRAKKAVDGRMQPGQIFAIQLPDATVAIGVTENGLDLYCEVADEHVRLSEDELHALMFALGRLRADVSTVQQAVVQLQTGAELPPAALRRGFAIRVPGGDDEWI